MRKVAKNIFLINIFICSQLVLDADTVGPGASGKVHHKSAEGKEVHLVLLRIPVNTLERKCKF